jgi:hypothetical protein
MFDEGDFDRAACGDEERRAFLPLASSMRELAELASSEGLFALGRYSNGTDADLAAGIRELLSYENSVPLSDRLRAAALAGEPRGAALLRRIVIAEGLSGIDAGIEPGLVEESARACLGAGLFFETKKWETR